MLEQFRCFQFTPTLFSAFIMVCFVSFSATSAAETSFPGVLKQHHANRRYFADPAGDIVYLTGSHTWCNLQDMGKTDPPEPFDYDAYLDFLIAHNHNFMRLWRWEFVKSDMGSGIIYSEPQPWIRKGPGNALDGKAKFDLERFNQAYFDRLRSRVIAAGNRGIYVSIMFFEGWGLHGSKEPWCWDGHPFNKDNNVNGIDGDPDSNGRGLEINMLAVASVTAIQEAYVKKVIETVNDLDNVLYEIVNESGDYSTEWQYHFIGFIKDYESKKPKQHPVGMTFQYNYDKTQLGKNETLFSSPADWISPHFIGGWRDNPPDDLRDKVVLSDTDHLWGIGGNRVWVWISFCRGLNPIFMDRYGYITPVEGKPKPKWVDYVKPKPDSDPEFDTVRQSLGFTRSYAQRMDLENSIPRRDLASTSFCLANMGIEYLIYAPEGGEFTVDLNGAPGSFSTEWMNPESGEKTSGAAVKGNGIREFTAPFTGDAVLYLKAVR